MDRNFNAMQVVVIIVVALRKESVDRNRELLHPSCTAKVALRKESVDRNQQLVDTSKDIIKVALRKESVDRNYIIKITRNAPRRSLSARRAWIEIMPCFK